MKQIQEKLTREKAYLNDLLHLKVGIGGREYFRGLLKAAFNLLGANAIEIALRPCFDRVRAYILDGNGDDTSHIRWLTTADRLAITAIGSFDHFVAVYARGNKVDGIVQFFGGISHMVRLSDNYNGPGFCFGYQVDPLRESALAETRNPIFNPDELPKFDEGSLSVDKVRSVYNALLSRFWRDYDERASEGEISHIVDEVLFPRKGGTIAEDMIDELTEKLAKFFASRIGLNFVIAQKCPYGRGYPAT